MQLTKELISPYLPHGLNCLEHGELIGVRNWIGWCAEFKDKTGSSSIPLSAIKPYLRPLSQLTQVIEHNGEVFEPAQKIIDDRECDAEYEFTDAVIDDMASADSKMAFAPYSVLKKLLEWHFDVFGLIEQGLALPIQ